MNPPKGVQTFLIVAFFQKRIFVKNNCWFLVENYTFAKNENIYPISSHKNVFLKKDHDPKMFGTLFFDSVYFSESKTTFGMFGIITFAVDSQTHTECPAQVASGEMPEVVIENDIDAEIDNDEAHRRYAAVAVAFMVAINEEAFTAEVVQEQATQMAVMQGRDSPNIFTIFLRLFLYGVLECIFKAS
jgi:hypothetical protein